MYFGYGFKLSIVVALIMIVYVLLIMTVVFPDRKEKALEMQEKEWRNAETSPMHRSNRE